MLIKFTPEQKREIKEQLVEWARANRHLNQFQMYSEAHRQFYKLAGEFGFADAARVMGRSKKPKYSNLGMTYGMQTATEDDVRRYAEVTDGAQLGKDGVVIPVLLTDNDLLTDRFMIHSFSGMVSLYEKYNGRGNDFNHRFDALQSRGRLINMHMGSDPSTELHPDSPISALERLSPSNPLATQYVGLWGDFAMPRKDGDSTIKDITSGLMRDVSIAFSVAPNQLLCSMCLEPMRQGMCFDSCKEHGYPGGRNEETGELMVSIMNEAADAFTFGIVSDGAVKQAGFVLDPDIAFKDKEEI